MRRTYLPLLLAAALLASACRQQAALGGDQGVPEVIASRIYAADAPEERNQKLNRIRDAVERLRDDSTSGWQARQDDVTGLAAELSGGGWRAPDGSTPLEAVELFLSRYGEIFGLEDPEAQLDSPNELEVDDQGTATFRSWQRHRDVPVDGASMLVAVDDAETAPTISFARGRIFPDIDVEIEPALDEAEATSVMEERTGGRLSGTPTLVVYALGEAPVLAWSANLFPVEDQAPEAGVLTVPALVFVDASSAALLEVRPAAHDAGGVGFGRAQEPVAGKGTSVPVQLPAAGERIELSAKVVGEIDATIAAERMPDGSVALIDSTAEGADRSSGRNVITVHDGSALGSMDALPGPIFTGPADALDKDAVSAAWATKQVLDYYQKEHGRNSYDDRGSLMVSTVTAAAAVLEDCNAFFFLPPGRQQMVYSTPAACAVDGEPQRSSVADLGTIMHEVTHGVTNSNAAGLGDTVQETAINEGISDYFAVVLQERVIRKSHSSQGALACVGIEANNSHCVLWQDGNKGLRNVNTGATMGDYQFTLAEPLGISSYIGDDGHRNSMVFTNTLWEIRKKFAALEGKRTHNSGEAKKFDRIVYRALTRYFSSDMDFISAGDAILKAAKEIKGISPRQISIIHKQFLSAGICRKCILRGVRGIPVATGARLEARPQVTKNGLIYSEWSSAEFMLTSRGVSADRRGRNKKALVEEGTPMLAAVAAGDYSAELIQDIETGVASIQLRNLSSGEASVLSENAFPLADPAISQTSVAWLEGDGTVLKHRVLDEPDVRETKLPAPSGLIAVDGSIVVFQLFDGSIGQWNFEKSEGDELGTVGVLDSERLRSVGIFKTPGGLAVSGGRAAVLSIEEPLEKWRLEVFELGTGETEVLSRNAGPFGVVVRGDIVIWAENVGRLGSRILRSPSIDTDLMAYSFKTGRKYLLLKQRGQQGFPSWDGTALAWQESALGGNDIFLALLSARDFR